VALCVPLHVEQNKNWLRFLCEVQKVLDIRYKNNPRCCQNKTNKPQHISAYSVGGISS
jgi:hypothetical protein